MSSRTIGFCWWKTTSYRAKITAEASGVAVKKVEYSLDSQDWQRGSSFTSRDKITKFYIRVTNSTNAVWLYEYENGKTTKQ